MRFEPFRHLLYVVPTLLALWVVDRWLSEDRTLGGDRALVRSAYLRWMSDRRATVIMLGSSTSGDWIRPQHFEAMLGLPTGRVLDGHIKACHVDCTYAEVRQLLELDKRYDMAFFGTNLYPMCEWEHPKRVMQQEMLLPATDLPDMMRIYAHAQHPLSYVGRYFGMALSGAYADGFALEKRFDPILFGEGQRPPRSKKPTPYRWYRDQAPPKGERLTDQRCSYEPDEVAYKRAALEALLDDLGRLASHAYLMVLPDETLSLVDSDPSVAEAWRRHQALMKELVRTRPHVTLVDLVTGGASERRHFKDGLHLKGAGVRIQRALLAARLEELGVVDGKSEPTPSDVPEPDDSEPPDPER